MAKAPSQSGRTGSKAATKRSASSSDKSTAKGASAQRSKSAGGTSAGKSKAAPKAKAAAAGKSSGKSAPRAGQAGGRASSNGAAEQRSPRGAAQHAEEQSHVASPAITDTSPDVSVEPTDVSAAQLQHKAAWLLDQALDVYAHVVAGNREQLGDKEIANARLRASREVIDWFGIQAGGTQRPPED